MLDGTDSGPDLLSPLLPAPQLAQEAQARAAADYATHGLSWSLISRTTYGACLRVLHAGGVSTLEVALDMFGRPAIALVVTGHELGEDDTDDLLASLRTQPEVWS